MGEIPQQPLKVYKAVLEVKDLKEFEEVLRRRICV